MSMLRGNFRTLYRCKAHGRHVLVQTTDTAHVFYVGRPYWTGGIVIKAIEFRLAAACRALAVASPTMPPPMTATSNASLTRVTWIGDPASSQGPIDTAPPHGCQACDRPLTPLGAEGYSAPT